MPSTLIYILRNTSYKTLLFVRRYCHTFYISRYIHDIEHCIFILPSKISWKYFVKHAGPRDFITWLLRARTHRTQRYIVRKYECTGRCGRSDIAFLDKSLGKDPILGKSSRAPFESCEIYRRGPKPLDWRTPSGPGRLSHVRANSWWISRVT